MIESCLLVDKTDRVVVVVMVVVEVVVAVVVVVVVVVEEEVALCPSLGLALLSQVSLLRGH
jgi:hypothetical protein